MVRLRLVQHESLDGQIDAVGVLQIPEAPHRVVTADETLNPVNFVEFDGHVANVIGDGGPIGGAACIGQYGPTCSIDRGESGWGDLGDFLYEASGLGDAVDCVQGDLASCGWVAAGLTPAGKLVRGARAARAAKSIWRQTEFRDVRVFQMKHLDLKMKDARGRTNLERMSKGLAPLGPDGKPINLHHLTQGGDSALAEVTYTMHNRYRGAIHINPGNTYPSGINRKEFAKFRRAYWKNRHRALTD